jgi:hypothetical protein
MLSALIDQSSPRNVDLPGPTARANKVLGWDTSGFNISMVNVVAGTLDPDAANINYHSGVVPDVPRSVAARLRERISIKDFGTQVGEGIQANDDAALLAAIQYINGLTTSSIALYYPAGIYNHGPCPAVLVKSDTAIIGDGAATIMFHGTANGSVWLAMGNSLLTSANATRRVTVEGLTFDCSPSVPGAMLFRLDNNSESWFRELRLLNTDTFMQLGSSPFTAGAFLTNVVDCSGGSRNTGFPMFRLQSGGGLFISCCTFQNSVSGPSISTGNTFIYSTVVTFTLVR